MEVSSEYAVQMHGITKTFGTFKALDNVSLDIKKQSIHAILGENGAGKSTLMNVLYGLYQADEGEIFLNGDSVTISNPTEAIEHGIGMVHQHFMLVENFTVTENIVLGDEVCSVPGLLNPRQAREKVARIADEYGFDIDLDAKVEDISVGMQQRVEILKVLYRGAHTLILDEPTAVLTPQEIDQLIAIMRDLVSKGKTIVIITHKLKEIMASADECSIIRRGVYMGTVPVADSNESDLAAKMVGHHVNFNVEKGVAQPGDVVLSVRDVHVRDERKIEKVTGLSFDVHEGEIVGIAGIDGNGQSELSDAIDGLIPLESGSISIRGIEISNTSIKNVLNHAVATIPSDRHRWGLILPFTVAENSVLELHDDPRFGKGIRLNYGEMHSFASGLIEEYDIRPEGCADQHVGGLSGGNQQKLIIAREVSREPDLLIAVQPTRGLDVGAIEFVHRALVRERNRGAAILLISLELDEIMSVADRIDVMYGGTFVGSFAQGEVTEADLGLLMAGGGAK